MAGGSWGRGTHDMTSVARRFLSKRKAFLFSDRENRHMAPVRQAQLSEEPNLLSPLGRCTISLGYSQQGTSKGPLFFPIAQQGDTNMDPFSSGQGKGRGDKWAEVSIEVNINKIFFPRCVQHKPMQEK
jgi:hypothetical protein